MINSLQKYKIVKKINQYGGVVPDYIDVLTKDFSDILGIIFEDEKLFKNVKKSLYKLLEARPLLFMDPFKWKTMNKRVEKKKDLDPKIRAVFVLLNLEEIDLEELNKLLVILVNYILDSNILNLISKLSISHFGVEESVITSSEFKLSIFYSEVYSKGLNKLLEEVIIEFLKELEDFYKENPNPDKDKFKKFFINLCERFEEKPNIGALFRNMVNSINMIDESHQESHQEFNQESNVSSSPRSNTSIDPTYKPFDVEKYKKAFAEFNEQPQPSPPQPSPLQPSPPQPSPLQPSSPPTPPKHLQRQHQNYNHRHHNHNHRHNHHHNHHRQHHRNHYHYQNKNHNNHNHHYQHNHSYSHRLLNQKHQNKIQKNKNHNQHILNLNLLTYLLMNKKK